MLKLSAKDIKAATIKMLQGAITNTFETNEKRVHLSNELKM